MSSPTQSLYYGAHRMSFRAGTYLALIRMMGMADLVTRLYGHTALKTQTQRRRERTRNTIQALVIHGFENEHGRAALQKLCQAHMGLKASQEDYQYVLATFFLEPLRWNALYGRTAMTQAEIEVLLDFWHRLGFEMKILDHPRSLNEWVVFQRDVESRRLRFSPEGQNLAYNCLNEVVKLSLPWGTRHLFRILMLLTMDDFVHQTLQLASPPFYVEKIWKICIRPFFMSKSACPSAFKEFK
jgi:hypothetical protein